MKIRFSLFKFWIFFSILDLGILSIQCVGQNVPADDSDLPRLKTNLQDVHLSEIESNSGASALEDSSSPNQWQSLANPGIASEPALPVDLPANNPSRSSDIGGEATTTKVPKKDEYGPLTGWGVRCSGGAAIQQSLTASIYHGNGHLFYEFKPGARFDLETFYNITNGFYFGLEGGFIYNEISSVLATGGGRQLPLISGSNELGYAAFYQVPVLLNIRFQVPNTGRFRGYCTGGFGGVWDYITASSSDYEKQISQWNYAFQLGAGFQYNLLPGLDLDTSFKTFITPNPLLFSDGTSQVKTSYSYAIEIGLAYRF